METIPINTVKEIRDIKTDELRGYLVDRAYVPLDSANMMYQAVQKWIREGNTPEPAYTAEGRLEYFKNELYKELKDATVSELKTLTIHSTTIDKEVDAGDNALLDIYGLLEVLVNDTDTIDFRLADNTFVTVTKADLINIKKEIVEARQKIRQNKWKIEKEINDLKDPDVASKAKIDLANGKLDIPEETTDTQP